MNRLLVALLAAFDAVLAAAGGLAASLAPLTLLWIFALGGGADAATLWPAAATLWQFGHLVPVTVQLPGEYLAVAGIDPAAAAFVLSLAPLGFATFTALFAARSGGRAARAGEALTGAVSGSVVFAALTVGVALTGATSLVRVEPWQAMLFPALVFIGPCVLGAAIGAWVSGLGPAGRLRARVERARRGWGEVPGLLVRGAAIAVIGLIGVGALVLTVAVFAGGGQIVALFQAGNVDAVGAIVLALGQLAYLPTLVVWALSFAAGPGFALGTGTAVSPSGTQLGVLPGLPVLGAVPESTTPWLLLLALLPIAVGALAGWMLRSRFAAAHPDHEAYGPRLAVLAGVAALSAAVVALFAVCARGAIGPGRLAETGPEPGPLALAVGLEVALGAGILLLSPRRADRLTAPPAAAVEPASSPLPPVPMFGAAFAEREVLARTATWTGIDPEAEPADEEPEAGEASEADGATDDTATGPLELPTAPIDPLVLPADAADAADRPEAPADAPAGADAGDERPGGEADPAPR